MKIILLIFVCVAAINAFHLDHSHHGAGDGHDAKQIPPLGASIHRFAHDLLKRLKSNEKNVVYSPLSISMALTMILKGAKGETYKQLAHTLHQDNQKDDDIHLAAKKLLEDYKESDEKRNVTIELANALLAQAEKPIKDEYKTFIQNNYHAKVDNVDFANKGNEVLKLINDYVSEKTHGKILKLYEEPLSPSTVALLLNTLYFKGSFKYPFKTISTHKAKFYNSDKTESDVDFMKQQHKSYSHVFDAKRNVTLLIIPYTGNVSLLILLPTSRYGLDSVLEKLSHKDFEELINEAKKSVVEIELPKFKIESNIDLKKVLLELNLTLPFSLSADFSDIQTGISINEAKHKAKLEIDENGTEAAAVTSISFVRTSAIPNPDAPKIVVNHPFFYMIHDDVNHISLFEGCVNKL